MFKKNVKGLNITNYYFMASTVNERINHPTRNLKTLLDQSTNQKRKD